MKILYINGLYSPDIGGGAEITVQSIVEGMREYGHEVVVLTTKESGPLESDSVNGVKVYRVGIKNLFWHHKNRSSSAFERLKWHLRDRYNSEMAAVITEVLRLESPTVVSCHNLSGWSVAAWDAIAAAGIPTIQVVHDLYLLCVKSNMFKKDASCAQQCLECRCFRGNVSRLTKNVSAVVGVSSFVLRKITQTGYFEGAITRAILNARNIPRVPARTDTAVQAVRFGYIGTLSPSKGVEWLITEFLRVGRSATLVIAGRGDSQYVEHLKSLDGAGNIEFVGYVDRTSFYQTIDVCVVPSIWEEPLGMVAIEACANDIPVIASRRGGLVESIQDGINGLVCDPDEPESLGRAIERLVCDAELLVRLQKDARRSVENFIDVSRMIREYDSLYREVVIKGSSAC